MRCWSAGVLSSRPIACSWNPDWVLPAGSGLHAHRLPQHPGPRPRNGPVARGGSGGRPLAAAHLPGRRHAAARPLPDRTRARAAQFEQRYGRAPSQRELAQLAQAATFATRTAKTATLDSEQLHAGWADKLARTLGVNGDLLRIEAVTDTGLVVRRALDADPAPVIRRNGSGRPCVLPDWPGWTPGLLRCVQGPEPARRLGPHTAADAGYGHAAAVRPDCAQILDAAYLIRPQRFITKSPAPPNLPGTSWINQPQEKEAATQSKSTNGARTS
jgi:hypothetical protein